MTGISTLGQSLNQISTITDLQKQLATLERQLTTQKKTDLFSGLGNDVVISQKARADFSTIETYITNAKVADRRITLMNISISELRDQTTGLHDILTVQTQEGDLELDTIGGYARGLREFVFELLNEQDGDRYLFAASDSANRPVNNTGALDTYLDNQIQLWIDGTIDTDTFVENFTDSSILNDSIVGFSSALSSGNTTGVTARVDDNAEIDYTVRANDEAFRNLIVGVALFDRLDLALDDIAQDPDDPMGQITAPGATQEEQNENFYEIFRTVSNFLNNAIDDLDQSEFKLAQAQSQIQKTQEYHTDEQAILQNQISDVEDVDINEIAIKLNMLQIQVEASYRVTAAIGSLSLVNYI